MSKQLSAWTKTPTTTTPDDVATVRTKLGSTMFRARDLQPPAVSWMLGRPDYNGASRICTKQWKGTKFGLHQTGSNAMLSVLGHVATFPLDTEFDSAHHLFDSTEARKVRIRVEVRKKQVHVVGILDGTVDCDALVLEWNRTKNTTRYVPVSVDWAASLFGVKVVKRKPSEKPPEPSALATNEKELGFYRCGELGQFVGAGLNVLFPRKYAQISAVHVYGDGFCVRARLDVGQSKARVVVIDDGPTDCAICEAEWVFQDDTVTFHSPSLKSAASAFGVSVIQRPTGFVCGHVPQNDPVLLPNGSV